MQKIDKILPIRIILALVPIGLAACAAPAGQQAKDDIGPVTAYARNSLAAKNPEGLLRLGEGFERSGDFMGARKLYAQAKLAAPDLIDARIAYARATAKAGFDDEAVAELTLVLADAPDNAAAMGVLAQIHADAARYASAYKLLENLSSPTPDEVNLKGKIAHVLGQPADGHGLLLSALEESPDDARVLEAAALSFALSGEYAGAVSLLRRSMDRPTARNDAQKSLALVYALSGQRQLALRLARDVVPAPEMQRLDVYFRILPRFSPVEQAAAVFFDRLPADSASRLSGRATN